ncbi:hypothetical protein H5410_051738 [Solanum commersonii]|uniref:Uncharacterized protein n=1 Tax=Solanum commersonii TaxID=4109 RepID=A0A9J5X0B8_SOLCO|nr:hypothetical protein H5410_051738 [Solanum commersonii]
MDSAAVQKVAPECPPGLQSRRTRSSKGSVKGIDPKRVWDSGRNEDIIEKSRLSRSPANHKYRTTTSGSGDVAEVNTNLGSGRFSEWSKSRFISWKSCPRLVKKWNYPCDFFPRLIHSLREVLIPGFERILIRLLISERRSTKGDWIRIPPPHKTSFDASDTYDMKEDESLFTLLGIVSFQERGRGYKLDTAARRAFANYIRGRSCFNKWVSKLAYSRVKLEAD